MEFNIIWKLLNGYILVWFYLVSRLNVSGVSRTWWNLDIIPWHYRRQQDGPVVNQYQSNPYSISNPKYVRHTCQKISGYSYSQAKYCRNYFDHMPAVSLGVNLGLYECKRQLKYRYWNCSVPHNSDLYQPYTFLSTPEAAFAHAISTAGVLHAIARSCKESRMATCGCSQADRPKKLHRDWLWAGCGDNLLYAFWFTKHFVDSREKDASYPRGSNELSNILVNLHNNRAGRNSVLEMTSVACKCHGISASCSLRTCWKQLPPFTQVGHNLRQKYEIAKQVRFNKRGTKLRFVKKRYVREIPKALGGKRKIPESVLIYVWKPPNFCKVQTETTNTVFDTRGRECRLDSVMLNRCEILCCGRGYRTYTREVREKCQCKFIWCCEITCKVCIRIEQVRVCN